MSPDMQDKMTAEADERSGGYRMNITRCYRFDRDDGLRMMSDVMKMFRYGFRTIGKLKVANIMHMDERMGYCCE